MKRSVWVVLAVGVVGLLVAGCSQKEEPMQGAQPKPGAAGTVQNMKEQAADMAQNAGDVMAKEKEGLVDAANKALDTVQKGIQDLQAAAEKKGAEAKASFDQNVKPELDKRLADLQSSVAAAKDATGDAWNSAKGKLTSAMADLQSFYHEQKAKLTSPPQPAPSSEGGS